MKPKQSAQKAIGSIVKALGSKYKQGKPIKFLMVECTRGSKKKMYAYEGYQKALDTPVEVPITKKDGKKDVIVYKRENKVSKSSLEECKDLFPAAKKAGEREEDDEEEEVPKKKTTKKSTKKAAPKNEEPVEEAEEAEEAEEEKPKKKATKKAAKKEEVVVEAEEPEEEEKPKKKATKKAAQKSKKSAN